MIDPGPDMESHIRALSAALSSAKEIRILLTHGHSDHSGAACVLAKQTGGTLLAPSSYRPPEGADVPLGP